MATTTNYGWTTPNDTDLVKDGAAAIRTLGSSIDTTVFANASAGIPKTIVDAKGDIIAATAADTVSRLAVGANDTVLIADSTTATGLKWGLPSAGGMTLLSTTTLSGTSTTISSINQTYTNLQIFVSGFLTVGGDPIRVAPNNNSGITSMQSTEGSSSVGSRTNEYMQLSGNQLGVLGGNSSNAFSATIFNYASTTTFKPYNACAIFTNTSSQRLGSFNSGGIATTSAITSLVFDAGGSSMTGGTVLIYGVK